MSDGTTCNVSDRTTHVTCQIERVLVRLSYFDFREHFLVVSGLNSTEPRNSKKNIFFAAFKNCLCKSRVSFDITFYKPVFAIKYL